MSMDLTTSKVMSQKGFTMRRMLVVAGTLLCTLFFSFSAYAEEVLIVRWLDSPIDMMFQKRLKELRPSVTFKTVHAQRDKRKLVKILQKYDFSNTKLVYSFGTTGTKIVRGQLRAKIPHVFNAVSTPVLSNIADSIEKPGHNLTGAKMLIDLKTQTDILLSLKKIKTLSVWYDPREKQSQAVLQKIKGIAADKGIDIRLFRIIPDAKKFKIMISKASEKTNKTDALYVIASASFQSHLKMLHSKLDKSLLVMGVIVDYVQNGATIALGPDALERSNVVAEQAAKILGGANAGDIPISLVTSKNATLYVNKDKIGAAGLKDLDKLGLKVLKVGSK